MNPLLPIKAAVHARLDKNMGRYNDIRDEGVLEMIIVREET